MDAFKRNDALRYNTNTVNGRTADIHITRRGSDWYFAVCGMMGAMTLILLALSRMKPRSERIFFYIKAGITSVACVAYWTLGSNLGFTPIGVEWRRGSPLVRGIYREIFYVRYIDWFITTPLLLLSLMLTARMPWQKILWVILVDWIMIVTGLVGALVRSIYKWGYFFIACLALLYILYVLTWEGNRRSKVLGDDVWKAYMGCTSILLLTWILYPVCWGCSEGGNVISPDSEAVFYGILDIISKIVFAAIFVLLHWRIDPERLGLEMRDYDDDPTSAGYRRRESEHEKRPNTLPPPPPPPGPPGNHYATDPHNPHGNATAV